MYITAPAPVSTACFINVSHQSVCLYVYVARQRLCKHVTAATNTRYNIRIAGRAFFYTVCVVPKESLVGLSGYPHTVASQRLGKSVLAATKNC
jgi:hypothetical protein